MIYLDTPVALTQLLGDDRRPPETLWAESLVSSRLLPYELWTRLHQLGATKSHGEAARDLLARVAIVELAPEVLARALEPFPKPVRTLDALHLALSLARWTRCLLGSGTRTSHERVVHSWSVRAWLNRRGRRRARTLGMMMPRLVRWRACHVGGGCTNVAGRRVVRKPKGPRT